MSEADNLADMFIGVLSDLGDAMDRVKEIRMELDRRGYRLGGHPSIDLMYRRLVAIMKGQIIAALEEQSDRSTEEMIRHANALAKVLEGGHVCPAIPGEETVEDKLVTAGIDPDDLLGEWPDTIDGGEQ